MTRADFPNGKGFIAAVHRGGRQFSPAGLPVSEERWWAFLGDICTLLAAAGWPGGLVPQIQPGQWILLVEESL